MNSSVKLKREEALSAGFRPCKICQPTQNAFAAPPAVVEAIALVRATPKQRITDGVLKEHGISPDIVRRWFGSHYGMTFQAYQRMSRVNMALQELKAGRSATDTAFDSGYESLSGFGYTFKKMLGEPPKDSASTKVILIHRFTTPIGPMFVCATEQGVCLLEFVDRRMLETEFSDLQRLLNAKIIAGENEHIRQAQREIEEYFNGERQHFSVILHTPGNEFQLSVWRLLQTVPYGSTTNYQALATELSYPATARKVMSANGYNRVAILVPCHRIVGADGSLTGYGGGLARKQWLIEHERQNFHCVSATAID